VSVAEAVALRSHLPQVVYESDGMRLVREAAGGAYVVVGPGCTEVAVRTVSVMEYANSEYGEYVGAE
jgi:hypothetical protein